MTGSDPAAFLRQMAGGSGERVERPLAIEAPIAIEFGGIGYAVLMATPIDLDDLATGFALAERLIDGAEQVEAVDAHAAPNGTLLRVTLAAECMGRVVDRVRHRVSESGCGLCGIENLDQALRPLPTVTAQSETTSSAIFTALDRLRAHQPLGRETGAVHAAALCDAYGAIRLVREDVGRHNAFDKLIGAMLRGGLGWDGGFALLSSRCSFELVEKAALAGCPLVVTISAPTDLAVRRAAEAGVRLIGLARPDAYLEAL